MRSSRDPDSLIPGDANTRPRPQPLCLAGARSRRACSRLVKEDPRHARAHLLMSAWNALAGDDLLALVQEQSMSLDLSVPLTVVIFGATCVHGF